MSVTRALQGIVRRYRLLRDPISYSRSIGVELGQECRLLDIRTTTFGAEPYLVKLGNHVTVTSGVRFITHDGGVWVFRDRDPDIEVFGRIVVGDNVFIGINAIILPGVTIGNNCVIGSGSVVTKDIADNVVAAGVPARPIRTLDEYWQKSVERSFSIRSLPPEEKRRILEDSLSHVLPEKSPTSIRTELSSSATDRGLDS